MNNLGRAPSDADVANWVGRDYGSLAASLANEPEVRQNQFFWSQPKGQSSDVRLIDRPTMSSDLYSIVDGQLIAPGGQALYTVRAVEDESGRMTYSNYDTGEVFDLDELNRGITGYDKEITKMFNTMLGRAPDVSEVIAYNKQLKEGNVSLEDVAKGFAASPEYLQKAMPFLDPNADVNTKFEQGVRGFDEKGLTRGGYYEGLPTHYFDPKTGKLAAWFGTSDDSQQGTKYYTWHTAAELASPGADFRLAKESTRDVGKDWRTTGIKVAQMVATAFAPQLAAYLAPAAGAGLTAAEAAALMGGTLSEAGAASMLGGQLASTGVNWGAITTQAAKTAAINAAVTAASGGNINDVLKAGALGAVTGGAGVAGSELLGGGTLAQIGTQTAISTAMAVANGQDPLQAALSGAINASASSLIPSSTADVLNGAGITDPNIQKAVNSAISSSEFNFASISLKEIISS
jgi:hypothetical protein